MALTSPWWAPEDHGVLSRLLQPLWKHSEGIALNPPDLLRHTVNFGIVLGAGEDFWVFLDGEDLFPASRKRESDGVAAGAGKRINQYGFRLWRTRDLLSYSPKMPSV